MSKDVFFFVLLGVGAVIAIAVYVLRGRAATETWGEVAKQLGGTFAQVGGARQILLMIDGRPVVVRTVVRGGGGYGRHGRNSHTYTVIGGAVRHPDDLAAGTPAPAPTFAAWSEAFADAEARAGLADFPRPPLPTRPELDLDVLGVVTDVEQLRGLVQAEADGCAAYERPLALWTAAAAGTGLKVRAAYLLEGEERGCKVRLVADHVSKQVIVRAFGETRGDEEALAITTGDPPGGMEDLPRCEVAPAEGYVAFARPRGEARLTDAARAALREARPSSVVAGARDVVVIVPGLTPEIPRWQAAIALAAELAAMPGAGAFRS